MKSISSIAVAVSLLAGGTLAAAPALAQKKQAAAPAQAGEKKLQLSNPERAALGPLQQAVQAKDFAKAATLLPAAQAAAKGADARYVLANLQLQIALGTNDQAGQAAAIETMIASGGVPASEMPKLQRALVTLYTNLKQPERARAALQKLGEIDPNDIDVMLANAEATAATNKVEAIAMIERAIAAQKAKGQPVPDTWYKRALRFAYEAKLPQQTTKISRDLVAAYPTPDNWRDALTIYRQSTTLDKQSETDLLRLMRAAKAMKGDSDYFTLASHLNDLGLPGESKAVIDEGVAANKISASKDYFRQLLTSTSGRVSADRASLPGLKSKALAGNAARLALTTGDAFYGYGDYASAAELYRAALQKQGVDANVANTRLGAALALAGRRAEAEAALKAVTGNRATLASFWMLWLQQQRG